MREETVSPRQGLAMNRCAWKAKEGNRAEEELVGLCFALSDLEPVVNSVESGGLKGSQAQERGRAEGEQ